MTIQDTGALFQIGEPSAPVTVARAPGRGIGIDLGTTNSLVALCSNGGPPRVLGDHRGLVPSVVSYVGDSPLVGREALAQQIQHPMEVVSSVKRFMGRGVDDIDFLHPYRLAPGPGPLRLVIGERVMSPVEVSAEILKMLRVRAEACMDGPVDGAVITVPAYFDDAQRQATRDAGRIAGLKVYRLLAEPTAAALAYGLDRKEQGLFAVYDLGGGTFDISILRLHAGVFQVLAIGGDSALGGDDIDRALAQHLLKLAEVHAPTNKQLEAARLGARELKEKLTAEEKAWTMIPALGPGALDVSRADLDVLAGPILQRTARACRQALKDAGVRANELDGVVMVGGSTRMPAVRTLAEQLFGRPPLTDINPDEVVALGAAIQADILSGTPRAGVTLLDVVPLSLGLETMGGIVEKIIPRNATIPISARQVFTNYSEQQTGMVMHVVQGERELARDNRSLAKFDLKGIPRLPPSMARVEVTFQLDADALLTVTARELMTGIKQSVEVKPTYGLSEEEVDKLVLDSLDNAGADYAARSLAEARVELGRVVLAVRTSLAEVGHIESLLPPDDRMAIEAGLTMADEAMADAGKTGEELTSAREKLERICEPFAARRMQRALSAGMTGKSLHEIEKALADEQIDAKRGGHTAELVED